MTVLRRSVYIRNEGSKRRFYGLVTILIDPEGKTALQTRVKLAGVKPVGQLVKTLTGGQTRALVRPLAGKPILMLAGKKTTRLVAVQVAGEVCSR